MFSHSDKYVVPGISVFVDLPVSTLGIFEEKTESGEIILACKNGACFAVDEAGHFEEMLPKFFASWLVVLIVAPFTAPFATCDVLSLLGIPSRQYVPLAPSTSVVLATDQASLVSSPGRVRLLALSRIPHAKSAAPPLKALSNLSIDPAGCITDHILLSAILRV
jgi:hypothetical protein